MRECWARGARTRDLPYVSSQKQLGRVACIRARSWPQDTRDYATFPSPFRDIRYCAYRCTGNWLQVLFSPSPSSLLPPPPPRSGPGFSLSLPLSTHASRLQVLLVFARGAMLRGGYDVLTRSLPSRNCYRAARHVGPVLREDEDGGGTRGRLRQYYIDEQFLHLLIGYEGRRASAGRWGKPDRQSEFTTVEFLFDLVRALGRNCSILLRRPVGMYLCT